MLYETFEKIYALEAAGKKIAKLNVGEPDWGPPAQAVAIAKKSIAKGLVHYGSSQGQLSLREKLASLHGCSAKNVAITPGSKWGIYALMKNNLPTGSNAVFFSPFWGAYGLMCSALGAEARAVPLREENGWATDLEKLENAIDSNTRLIVLNSPSNPTSKALSEKDEKEIFALAQKYGIRVLVDDAYRDILFEKRKERQYGENLLAVHTFSKTFGMTGWRVGYTIAPEAEIKKIVSLNQITFTNVPIFAQVCAEKALDYKEKVAAKARKSCRERAEIAKKSLGKSVSFEFPDAGFYIFPRLSHGIGDVAFSDKLLEKGFAVVPGQAFGNYPNHFRMSLSVEKSTIKSACAAIVQTIEKF